MSTKIRQSSLDNSVIIGNDELAEAANASDILLVYDASAGTLKKILASNVGTQVVTFTSVSPTNAESGDGTGNHTFTITGTNLTGATAELINSSGTTIAFDSVTVDSATQITAVIAKSSLPNSGEPYDVRIIGSNGLQATKRDQITVDASPVFTTASGTLGTQLVNTAGVFHVNATDPESAGNVTFELQSGSLPPGYTLTNQGTEGGTVKISGTDSTTSSTTTFNFVLRAVDAASNTTSRSFSITSRTINYQSFTSSGTFAVPSGVSSLTEVLVVAGGGAGGDAHTNPQGVQGGGGGGAGGLIFMPTYPVTPGGTITVTVGCGGTGPNGQNSSFGSPGDPGLSTAGVLSAIGGGAGAGTFNNGNNGGSGGGAAGPGTSGGTGNQPTQPGNSGAYGFGGQGGPGVGRSNGSRGAGGGGASPGPSGQGACGGGNPGVGGQGRSYTIADGTTPVGYAGGGGGGGGSPQETGGGAGATSFGGGPGGNSGVGGNPGTANRGGGAGGGGGPGGSRGCGGKGVVIIKY